MSAAPTDPVESFIARSQAENYARDLSAGVGRPPFLMPPCSSPTAGTKHSAAPAVWTTDGDWGKVAP